MSVTQRIFGMFGGAAANANQQPPQNPNITNNPAKNPAPQATAQSGNTAPNGLVPEGSEKPPEESKSPLEKFSTVWEPPKTDDSNKSPEPVDKLSPQKMMEAAAQVDFSAVLDRETVAKIAGGGEEAVKALIESLNKTSQAVYGRSTVVAQALIDNAVKQAEARFATQVPKLVQRQSAREGLIADNPAFNHPAVAPLVSAMELQLQQKFPQATSMELKEMAKDYFAASASAFNPPQKSSKSGSSKDSASADTDDWVDWATSNPRNIFN
jgi:hypothetical protein